MLLLSCGKPQLKQKIAGADFTAENLLSRIIYIAPAVNMTKESNLDAVGSVIEKSFRSERKYYNWSGTENTARVVNDAGLSKEFNECLRQYSKNMNIDRTDLLRLAPALKDNYIVFAYLKEYGETDDPKIDKDFHRKKIKTTYTESYHSYLSGGVTVYDMKTGMAVFTAVHDVDYTHESSAEREDRISTDGPKDMAGDCLGSCLADMTTVLVSGLVTALLAPAPEHLAGKLFSEIGENLPEKR